jgi:Protein of unknown function (DUF1203)
MSFRCVAISTEVADRFRRSDRDDSGNQIEHRVADKDTGFFCRHCLGQPGKGREVLLANYHVERPQGVYWSPSPVFVHADSDACPRFLRESEIPKAVRDLRLVGLRSYDAEDHMLYDLTILTENVHERVEEFLGDPRTSYVNIHSSGPGCYLCRVERL